MVIAATKSSIRATSSCSLTFARPARRADRRGATGFYESPATLTLSPNERTSVSGPLDDVHGQLPRKHAHRAILQSMITIYHLNSSRSERIVWLMEELALPYRLEPFRRKPDAFAPDELKHIHPLGRAPVIRDGATVLAESGAIVDTSSRATGAAGWRWHRPSPTSRATSSIHHLAAVPAAGPHA